MDISCYRKYIVGSFTMIIKTVEAIHLNSAYRYFNKPYQNHPLVLSKNAFWLTDNKLCLGYTMDSNDKIFRPVFSHIRQGILSRVNFEYPNHVINFWNTYRARTKSILYNETNWPEEIITIILNLAYPRPKKINNKLIFII